MRFDELGLSPDVLRAVTDAGYIEPTPIQEKAIRRRLLCPAYMWGRGVVCQPSMASRLLPTRGSNAW